MWYESMLLMRKFEEKAGQLYGQQKIRGFCHLYIGQETVLAGAMSVIKPEDSMITAYRDHAHAIAKGVTSNAIMAIRIFTAKAHRVLKRQRRLHAHVQ